MCLIFVINSECLWVLLLLMLSRFRLALPHPPGLWAGLHVSCPHLAAQAVSRIGACTGRRLSLGSETLCLTQNSRWEDVEFLQSHISLSSTFKLQPHVESNGNIETGWCTLLYLLSTLLELKCIPKHIKYYVKSMCNSSSTWLAWV